jgi:hypothetical protein
MNGVLIGAWMCVALLYPASQVRARSSDLAELVGDFLQAAIPAAGFAATFFGSSAESVGNYGWHVRGSA